MLDNPIIIQRPGQYHITLAPQLNRAQTFIEQIAKQFSELSPGQGEFSTQYFEVHDSNVIAQGESFYLLAISLRGGVLYFQAINPQPLLYDADSHLKTVRKFSEAVLALHPLIGTSDGQGVINLGNAVEAAASQLQIGVKIMQAID